jgi:hypothetical protein
MTIVLIVMTIVFTIVLRVMTIVLIGMTIVLIVMTIVLIVIIVTIKTMVKTQPRSQGFSVRTRRDTRNPWSGPVTWRQKMAVFDSYSSRSGEMFFNEIYKSSKQINSQKTSQSILFMCRAKFGTNQLKYMKTPSMFSKIYRYFCRFSTTGKAVSELHLGVSMQVMIHTKFAFSRLEQYGYCYN